MIYLIFFIIQGTITIKWLANSHYVVAVKFPKLYSQKSYWKAMNVNPGSYIFTIIIVTNIRRDLLEEFLLKAIEIIEKIKSGVSIWVSIFYPLNYTLGIRWKRLQFGFYICITVNDFIRSLLSHY